MMGREEYWSRKKAMREFLVEQAEAFKAADQITEFTRDQMIQEKVGAIDAFLLNYGDDFRG